MKMWVNTRLMIGTRASQARAARGRGGTRRDTQSDTSASITLHTAQRELVFNWAHANVYPVTKTPDNDSFYNTFGRPIFLSKVPSTGQVVYRIS